MDEIEKYNLTSVVCNVLKYMYADLFSVVWYNVVFASEGGDVCLWVGGAAAPSLRAYFLHTSSIPFFPYIPHLHLFIFHFPSHRWGASLELFPIHTFLLDFQLGFPVSFYAFISCFENYLCVFDIFAGLVKGKGSKSPRKNQSGWPEGKGNRP